jgi:hypothetical protein
LLLKAISDKAKTNLADHDSNPSPHNLPSYARMENTGFKVYDDKGNLRTHSGQYSPGEYGFWVDAGHYMLRDMGIDMSLVQLPNLIPDHSFECLEAIGAGHASYFDYAMAATSGDIFDWNKVGEPRVYPVTSSGTVPGALYGLQSVVVNSANYLALYVPVKSATAYFLSVFASAGWRNSTCTAKIIVEGYEAYGESAIFSTTKSFPLSGAFNWKRIGFRLYVPNHITIIKIKVLSSDSNWVYLDGIQLVMGDKPVRYDPEENLWRHMFGAVGVELSGHIVESGSNQNGRYVRFSDGTQICWFYGEKYISINNAYGDMYQGSINLTYPVSYYSKPTAAIGRTTYGTSASWGSVSAIGAGGLTLRFYDLYSRSAVLTEISYLAVGRWK